MTGYPTGKTPGSVVGAFEAQAQANPEVAAVCFGTECLSYGELSRRTDSLAHQLLDAGVTPGESVGLGLDPGPHLAVAILGALKAGATYVPISPVDPVERIAYQLGDAGAKILLTEGEHAASLGGLCPSTLLVDDLPNLPTTPLAPDSALPKDDARPAYILYTSGSSGRPKGVAASHRSLAYYLSWHRHHLYVQAGNLELPLSSSVCFAAGVTQFYTPLLNGQTLHILPRGVVRNPEELFAWYEGHPRFGLYCVPTLWNELVRFAVSSAEAGCGLTPPRAVLLSGEAVTEGLVNRSLGSFPNTRLWNLYGPTEATANCSYGELRAGAEATIGKPIAGTEIYLLDPEMRRVAPGETGEICVSGDGVANGYVNLPEATADRFVAHPFAPDNGKRLFRTGDLARLNEEGDLVYIGRKDFQLQIRGHRVECGEIEAALQRHTAVRQAVVTGISQEGLDRSLAAYVTFGFARYASVDELRAFLVDMVPDYMIPGAFVLMDSFPKLANGKVDRSRLPAPGRSRPLLGYDFVAPRTLREGNLVRIWEVSLGLEGIGVEDNFFDLGGDSLAVAAALLRIAEQRRANVSYADFFAHPTPAAMATFLGGHREGDPSPDSGSIVPRPDRGQYPIAPNQRALWLLIQTFPDTTAYTIQFTVRFTGELDRPALEKSVAAVVERNEVLRTVFLQEDGQPVARILDFGPPILPFHDLTSASGEGPESEADHLTVEASRIHFDLEEGPLYRFALLRTGEDRHRLLVTLHHLVFDGRSINIFCRELVEEYRRIRAGQPSVPVRALQFGDWSAWRRTKDEGDDTSFSCYWREELGESSLVQELATDFHRSPVPCFDGAVRTLRISQDMKDRLTSFSRGEGVTSFMTLLAIFNLLLHSYSGQEEILIGSPVANRGHADAEGLLGFFANTVVLRTELESGSSFKELLSRVRRSCLGAFQHQAYPFEALLDILRPERSLNRAPVFQVMFALHEALLDTQVDEGLVASVHEDGNGGAKYDLTLDVHDLRDGMEFRLTYRTDLFADATVERLLERYMRLMDTVMADPTLKLARYGLFSESDRRVIRGWNDTAYENEGEKGLTRLFEEQASRTPDTTALVAGDVRLSYRELDGRASEVARGLRVEGVKKGDAVGLHLEPSANMLVALLGVLKAGAAYVPLDPYYPRERLDHIVSDAGLARLITTRRLGTRLDTSVPYSYMEEGPVGEVAAAEPAPGVAVFPDDLMYLLYTSGSSGTPKGVRLSQLGPCNFVLWMRDTFPLTPDDAVLLRTSINFDISVWEIFLPLITGARLVVGLRDELQSPDALAALIQREGVTNVQFVPSALRAFVDAGVLTSCTSLARIFSGGEELPRSLQNEVMTAFPGELHNLYGPTEASIYVCHWKCRQDDRYQSVPIGRPIHNTQIHLLDEHGREVPIGMVGEVYIGGPCVAQGYHRRPEQTAASFVDDPFSPDPAARLFRTGDSARYLPGGDIEFLGRSDRQVKVRGYRLELGEIEHQLTSHPNVKHAIIIVREDDEGDVRLVAYLLYDKEKGPEGGELRTYLKKKLPDYMIPSTFVTLDSIPLLPNSKADVSKLPKPEYQKAVTSELGRF